MKDLRFIYIKDNQNISTDLRQKVNEFNSLGETFNEKHLLQRTNKKDYDLLKAKNDNSWSDFKPYFEDFSDYRCPICEQILTKYDDIEHFRPKEYYWWLAYEYKNYYAVCASCNRGYKSTDFPILHPENRVTFETQELIEQENPLLFNPTIDNPLDIFEIEFVFETVNNFYLKINPLSILDKQSYLFKKAETTIKSYNLNNTEEITNSMDSGSRKVLIKSLCNNLFDLAKTKIEYESKKSIANELEKWQLQIDFFNLKAKYKRFANIGLSTLIMNGNMKPFEEMMVVY